MCSRSLSTAGRLFDAWVFALADMAAHAPEDGAPPGEETVDDEADHHEHVSDLTSPLHGPIPPKAVQEALRRAWILIADSPPPDPALPHLFVMEPGCRPHWEVLPAPRCTLGRGEGADVRVNSRRASRTHAEFTLEEGFWHVRDVGSRHGSFVGTAPVEEKRCLLSGDLVRFGDVYALFVDGRTRD